MSAGRVRLTLIESARRWSTRAVGTQVSSAATQIGLLVGGFVAYGVWGAARLGSAPEEAPSFIAPLKRLSPRAQQEQLRYVGLPSAESPVMGDKIAARDEGRTPMAVEREGGPLTDLASAVPLEAQAPSRPLSDVEVDSTVARDPESAGPEYPAMMLLGRVEGGVLARFVVDTNGRADSVSFRVVQATDTAFVLAVRAVLPRMKYRPAFLNGVRVAQLVEQYFTFKISPTVDGTSESMSTIGVATQGAGDAALDRRSREGSG